MKPTLSTVPGRILNQTSGYYERSPDPKILTSTPQILHSTSAQAAVTHGSHSARPSTLNANQLTRTWTFLLSNDHSSDKVHLIPRTESFHHCSHDTCNNSDIYNASGKVQLIPLTENFDHIKNVGPETIVKRKRFWGFEDRIVPTIHDVFIRGSQILLIIQTRRERCSS
jgi:hypothetical protein